MKIYLKNFKCWTSKIITLEDNGIQLLSGESGKGKSSVLDALYFCLYGNMQKIITHGQKSCQVDIEYGDLKITRSRRPNRLVVVRNNEDSKSSEVLEDDIAQEFINQTFGHHFSQTSYIKQNGFENFVFMSPTEKLEFLEDSILKKFNVDSLKTRLQSHIKRLEQDINIKSGQYSTYLEILNKTSAPVYVEFPIKCNEKTRDLIIKNERTKIHNFNILIKKYTKKIAEAKEKLYKNKTLEESINSSSIRIVELNRQKEEYTSKLSSLKSDKYLQDLVSKVEKIDSYNRHSKISQDLETELEIYNNKLKEEIYNATNSIKKVDKSQLSSMEETIESLKNKIKYLPRINEIRSDLDRIPTYHKNPDPKEIDLLLQSNSVLQNKLDLYKKTLTCPCCNIRLLYRESQLEKYKDDEVFDCSDYTTQIENNKIKIDKIKKDIKLKEKRDRLQQELSLLPTIYTSPSHPGSDTRPNGAGEQSDTRETQNVLIKQLETAKSQYRQIMEIINENKRLRQLLESNNFPSLTRSRQIITTLREQLGKITKPDSVVETYNREQIKNEIYQIRLDMKLRKEYQDNVTHIGQQLEKLTLVLEEAKTQLSSEKIPNIVVLEKKLEDYRQDIEMASKNVDQIDKWATYTRDIGTYKELESKVGMLDRELAESRKELTLCQKFKTSIMQAETLSIQQFINTINSHVQIYLDHFFKTDQLLVKIDTEKQMKSNSKITKSQITLNMEYKGYPVELTNLSGGELSRLNLAFVLALSEIFQSPILMLDECMSTLDPDNCFNVLQTIRENYKGKVVVMIHHQITEGLFDNVVNL